MTQSTANKIQDPFDSDDFAPEKVRFPWLQVLNNEEPEKSGLFLTLDNCAAAEISIPDSWQIFKARFKSGEVDRSTGKFLPSVAEGYLFTQARMIVVRKGELTMYSKRSNNSPETYIGHFDHKTYQEQKSSLILKTRYLIYLLSDDNQLLHESPIQFTAKGVFGATFSEHLRAFQSELQKAYGKQRGEKFLINGIFDIKSASELRGNPPDTAWVTVVESHQIPTQENWQSLFVGYDEPLREKLLADYETFSNFDSKSQPAEAQNNVDPATGEITGEVRAEILKDQEVPW